MNYLLTTILMSVVLASTGGRAGPLPAIDSVDSGATPAVKAALPGREAFAEKLRASVPVVREQAATVGSEIAARALAQPPAVAARPNTRRPAQAVATTAPRTTPRADDAAETAPPRRDRDASTPNAAPTHPHISVSR